MILTSKYAGRCITCGAAIAVGQQVEWIKGRKGVVCCIPEIKALTAVAVASRQVDADVDVPAPDGLAYLGFQRAGVAYALAAKEGVLFGDEMGLGKTIQVVGYINADPSVRRVLVICPKTLVLNWVRELRKWLTRSLAVYRVGYEQSDDAVVVASYEEVKKYQALLTRGWDLLAVDEAHLIKNDKAQRSKAVRAVAEHARRRFALTGTPIQNKPVELFPLLALVAPQQWNPGGYNEKGQAKGFFKFALRYCGGHRTRWGWDFSGATNLPALQNELRSTCMVRRLKKDVLTELPAKRRQIVLLDGDGAGRAVQAENAAWDAEEDRLEGLRADAELARAADDPGSYEAAAKRLGEAQAASFAAMSRLRHATALSKVDAVVEHVRAALEDDEDHKVVVFGHHVDVIDQIAAGLAEFSPVTITGQTEILDRQANVDRFQTDPRCRVFVGNIIAAGVGITLTASAHVVFAELSWVPGEVSQAEDRCHRIGQTDSVLVQHLILDGSLDARMVEVILEKQAIADKGLDAVMRQAVLPGARPATEGKRAELDALAARLAPKHVDQVHAALRHLAGACDGARGLDGAGFSKIDVRIGHELANAARLTPRQAALGLRLCRKYRRQLGEFGEMMAAFMDLAKELPAREQVA